jgi:hypothetical protein
MTDLLCAILRGMPMALPASRAGDALVAEARAHRVHLLLAWTAGQGPSDLERLGGDGWTSLAREMRVEVLTEGVRRAEVGRVIGALDRAGAQPIVFKGAALAHTHYAEPWLRPRLDTDILVAPAHRERAIAALTGLGYERPPFVSGEHVMHQAPLVRPGPAGLEHVVDLHWRIANVEAVARMLTHEALLARAEQVDIGGRVLRVPAPDDALLLALAHRAAHHADSPELLWLVDIHRLASGLTPDQWDHVLAVAHEHGMRAVCARGLALSASTFGTLVPERVTDGLRATGAFEPAAAYLRPGLRPVDRLWIEVRTLGPRRGLRLLREHLFPPASYLTQAYGVRRTWLLPAFYARRVAFGLARWFSPAGRP